MKQFEASGSGESISRRRFVGSALGVAAATSLIKSKAVAAEEKPQAAPAITRKIKVGIIGLGGRGNWIAGLFRQHGGYEFHAVADYFPQVAEGRGTGLGVDKSRCFSGLSGYKKVIESGIEALIIEDVPYFYPEQAQAAVDAGLHVYMAKPVAVDVPGTLAIGTAGKQATQKQRVFFVDYQMPTDPYNIEVMKRIAAGGIGKLQTIFSNGAAGGAGFNDPPLTANLESRLQGLIWVNDNALGGGYVVNYDIHVVDAVLRAVRHMPVSAYGWGSQFRGNPHGDTLDTTCVMFNFADGMVWNHQSPNGACDDWFSATGSLATHIQGDAAGARLSYWGKSYVRGGAQHFAGGKVENLYQAGAVRNIAAFYEKVIQGQCANETVQCAVDSTLVCLLGREVAAKRTLVTMEGLIKENKRLEVDLTGLKA